jgi:hypothetical protein
VAAHSAVILKAESMSDKTEWIAKIKGIVDPKGLSAKKPSASEGGAPVRQSHPDGSLVCWKTSHLCFVRKEFVTLSFPHLITSCHQDFRKPSTNGRKRMNSVASALYIFL